MCGRTLTLIFSWFFFLINEFDCFITNCKVKIHIQIQDFYYNKEHYENFIFDNLCD